MNFDFWGQTNGRTDGRMNRHDNYNDLTWQKSIRRFNKPFIKMYYLFPFTISEISNALLPGKIWQFTIPPAYAGGKVLFHLLMWGAGMPISTQGPFRPIFFIGRCLLHAHMARMRSKKNVFLVGAYKSIFRGFIFSRGLPLYPLTPNDPKNQNYIAMLFISHLQDHSVTTRSWVIGMHLLHVCDVRARACAQIKTQKIKTILQYLSFATFRTTL